MALWVVTPYRLLGSTVKIEAVCSSEAFYYVPIILQWSLLIHYIYIYLYKVKVKQSRYRPGVAQKIPGS